MWIQIWGLRGSDTSGFLLANSLLFVHFSSTTKRMRRAWLWLQPDPCTVHKLLQEKNLTIHIASTSASLAVNNPSSLRPIHGGLVPQPLPLELHPQLFISRRALLQSFPRTTPIQQSRFPLRLQPPFQFSQTMDPFLLP